MRSRPAGVAILAFIVLLIGALDLCSGIFGLFKFSFGIFGALFGAGVPIRAGFDGIFNMAIGALTIFFGLGLWKLQDWARLGLLLVLGIRLLFAFIAIFTAAPFPWLQALLALIVVIYLNQRSIKSAFR